MYNSTVTTVQLENTVPSGTMTNGFSGGYTVSIRTYDASDNTSDWSTPVAFYCYTTPTITLNVSNGGTVGNSSYTFSATYDQLEEELLNYLKIDLYNSSDVLVATSGNLYSTATVCRGNFTRF